MKSIRILLIDDNPDDRDLAARELRRRFPGSVLQTAGTEGELKQALASEGFDLVITDYHLPWTDGIRILRQVRAKFPGVPVILFTGTGNEKIAARALKEGADDYVIKTAGRVPQLIMASQLALDRSAERQAALQARVRFESFAETLPIGWLQVGIGGVILNTNPAMARLLGYADRDSLMTSPPPDFFESPEARQEFHRRIAEEKYLEGYELRLRRKDGTLNWARFFAHPIMTADGKPAFEALVEDIHARKAAIQVRTEKEQEVHRLNERLRVILDAAPMAIIGMSTKGLIDFVWNRAAEQLIGKTREEAVGLPIFTLIPEMAGKREQVLNFLDRSGSMAGRLVKFNRPDGRPFHLSVHAAPLSGADGETLGAIGILMDVTERTRAEERLLESENRLSLVYSNVSDYLVLLGLEQGKLRVILANKSVEGVLEQPVADIIRRPLTDFFSRPVVAEMTRICHRVQRTREPYKFVSSTRLRKGRRESTENTLTPVVDADDRCTRVLLVAHNIQSRLESEIRVRQAMHALRESEQRYRALAEAAHDMIFILDREMRILYVNSFAARNFRFTAGQLVGQYMPDLFPPEIAARQAETLQSVFTTGESVYREAPSLFMGREAWLGTWLVPLRTSEGVVEEVLGLARDITERVRAERSLRESEEQYRSLVQTSPDGIILQELTGAISFSNRRAAEILGFSSPEDLSGQGIMELVLPEERTLVESQLRVLLDTGSLRNFVVNLRRRDGISVPVEVNATVIHDPQDHPKAIVTILRDITERRRREQELRDSEARFRAIFEKAAVGAVLLDGSRRVTECNNAMCEILGYSREEFLQLNLWEITLADDRAADQPQFDQVLANQLDHYRQEKRMLRMDGSIAWCRMTVSAVRGHADQLLFLIAMVEDVSKQREAEQETRQAGEALRVYAERLETLHQIDQAILHADSTEELARGTLEHMTRLVPCHRSSLVLFDMDTRMVTIVDARAQMETLLTKGVRIPFETYGSNIDALSRGELYSAEDLLAKPMLSPTEQRLLGEGIRTVLTIPLLNQGRLIGGLNIASGIPAAFTREHAEIAQEVANLLAVALQQARLLEQVRRHTFELETVAALNQALRVAPSRQEIIAVLLRQISAALQCEFVGLLAADQTTGEFVFEKTTDPYAHLEGYRIPPDTGMTGRAIFDRAPFRNNQPETIRESPYLEVIHSMRAIACVPLITRGQTIGVIWIGRARKENPAAGEITDEDMRLLSAIGDVAANAIHRATLHDQTEQRLQRLAALRAVDMAISASIDLRVSLSVLLDQVTAQLGVDAGDVLILDPRTQSLVFTASRGFHSPDRSRPSIPLGQGYAGTAALERHLVSIPRLEEAVEKFAVSLRTGTERFVSYFAVPLIAKGQVRGVLELYSRTVLEPDAEWLEFMETTAAQAAIAIDNSNMFEDLQRTNTDLIMAYDATIEGWARTLELRDRDTSGHTGRVTELTVSLARRMGIREADLIHVRRGALMHDIGKISVPDSILHKPGPLTPEEWEVMRQHPVTAYELLASIVYLRPAIDIPYAHHEKWDGSGYPRGLSQEQIPLPARVFAVIDVWDALRNDRPYRKAWPEGKVHEYLRAGSGSHFDPAVLVAFFELPEISRESGR